MLDDFTKEIQDRIDDLKSAKQVLEFLADEVRKLALIRRELDAGINRFDPTRSAITKIRELATNILWEQAKRAVRITKEFNLPMFTTGLKKAIFDPRTITITPSGKSDIKVQINLDITAGTLDQYGNAITQARSKLKNYGRVKDSFLSSWFWLEKYYKPAREGTSFTHPKKKKVNISKYRNAYWKTIRDRKSSFGALAPYWELIDQGNQSASLSSDTPDGIAYPSYGATDFVATAIRKIRFEFRKVHNESSKEQQKLYDALGQVEDKLNFILQIQNRIAGANIQDLARARLERQMRAKFPLADPLKLRNLLNTLLAGEEPKYARTTLTRSGSSNRVQVRTKYIQKLISRFNGGG